MLSFRRALALMIHSYKYIFIGHIYESALLNKARAGRKSIEWNRAVARSSTAYCDGIRLAINNNSTDDCNIKILCVFRWKSGVASSLNYITISDEKSPILHPYPNWELNTLPVSETIDTSSESTGMTEI